MSYYVLSDKKEQIEAYSKSEVYSKAEADSKLDSKLKELLNTIYPKGSIYISLNSTSPASFIGGSWDQLPSGRALWTATSGVSIDSDSSNYIEAGLPDIQGHIDGYSYAGDRTGAFKESSINNDGTGNIYSESFKWMNWQFKASSYNSSIYGKSSTVQPPAYNYAWRRTALA